MGLFSMGPVDGLGAFPLFSTSSAFKKASVAGTVVRKFNNRHAVSPTVLRSRSPLFPKVFSSLSFDKSKKSPLAAAVDKGFDRSCVSAPTFFGGSAPVVKKAIIGLGNPEEHFENSTHNIGFMILNRLAKLGDAEWVKTDKYGVPYEQTDLVIAGKQIKLVKPLTCMNNSGDVMSSLIDEELYDPEDITIVHDDLTRKLGAINHDILFHSWHNGVQSIIEAPSSSFSAEPASFSCISFGSDKKDGVNTVDHVLNDFQESPETVARYIEEITKNIISDLNR
jgi:PTH1 family peptidyl-tRNA hydrolase